MATLRFTYNGDPLEVDFDGILNTEAIEVEKYTGLAYQEWLAGLDARNVNAITALYWLALNRPGRDPVAYRDIKFPIKEWGQREWVQEAEVDPQTPGSEAGENEPA